MYVFGEFYLAAFPTTEVPVTLSSRLVPELGLAPPERYSMSCSGLGAALQPGLGLLAKIPGIRRSTQLPTDARSFTAQPPTPREDLNAKIARLDSSKKAWVNQTAAQRIQLLQRVLDDCLRVGPYLASDCMQAKGSSGGGLGEEA